MENPLSHSSAQLLLGCEQRFHFYKIERVTPDPGQTKSDALAIGSAFHSILERSLHEKPASITAELARCTADPDIGLDEEDQALVHGMVLRYLRLHKKSGLRVLAVEVEIKSDDFLGYIDAVMEDSEGKWSIVDLKTWGSLTDAQMRQLPKDPQMNLYGSKMALVAEQLGLLPENFVGVRWRVAVKSTSKRKKTEDYGTYVKRLADDHLRAVDIFIAKEKLDCEGRLDIHKRLWEKSERLRAGVEKPIKNFGNCYSYFRACEYFSRCHSGLFSEPADVEVTEE